MSGSKASMRCAGIVTYNPDLKRLRANLEAIVPQVDRVFVCDNGSDNVQDIETLAAAFPAVQLERLGENLGIAAALNCLLQAAERGTFDWIVLLDQDSVASDGMVDALAAHADETTGLVCPFILDRNRMSVEEYRAMDMPATQRLEHAAKGGAITSGSLVQVKAALAVGGFDERFFIDYVDFDFNERLLLAGYEILRVNTTYLLHEKGKSEATWLRVPRSTPAGRQWQPLYKLGYSPIRCYYQARNRIIYWKKYHRHTGSEGLTEIPLLMALSLLVEDRKAAKLGAYLRGIRAGVRAKVQPVGDGKLVRA
ncbi:glycosyltransferase [Bifidobacterium cuniculi]|uniref:Glycosyltransferase n=1 Tax=Bifidobacterium cuniculi TaxID=1688 RepID=A0A087AEW0_9BIFI|nr:glycosyltransferase [Bifidobacterium cuniculi]KFI57310.1 glycosyltransferase [Bifidobacterium cuniculi]